VFVIRRGGGGTPRRRALIYLMVKVAAPRRRSMQRLSNGLDASPCYVMRARYNLEANGFRFICRTLLVVFAMMIFERLGWDVLIKGIVAMPF
jgi:hypothetical protein